MRVVLSDQAKADLRDIGLFIARGNKSRARSFVRELQTKAREVGDMPRAFPLLPRYERHGIRRRPFRDYLIFYRIEDDRASVVHILHGAQDYEALLFPGAVAPPLLP
jgi:plasmid stabilization system protein ParE